MRPFSSNFTLLCFSKYNILSNSKLLAAQAAEPVYKLFGKQGPGNNPWPAPGDTGLIKNTLGYYMHDGGHGVLPGDYDVFIQFIKQHLH